MTWFRLMLRPPDQVSQPVEGFLSVLFLGAVPFSLDDQHAFLSNSSAGKLHQTTFDIPGQ